MAGSTIKTVHDIFQSMESGPAATSSYATAQVNLSEPDSKSNNKYDRVMTLFKYFFVRSLELASPCYTM